MLKKGNHDKFVVIGAGVTLYEALKAYDELIKENIPIAVIDLFSIKPLDTTTLLSEAKRVGGRIITVEDHYQSG